MSRIRMHVFISNESDATLILARSEIAHGSFTASWSPPATIYPGRRVGFQGEGDFKLTATTGTEGRVYYNIVAPDGSGIVTGDVKLNGGDLAESFEVTSGSIEPGTVMVLDGVDRVRECASAYDKRVAGVVSGAGDYRPGIMLDHRDAAAACQPLAMVGRVFCKVDASYDRIEMGDLLTTSPTPGHAMKARDAAAAFGAVLGKAMADREDGHGLIPILVALQ